MKAPLEPVRWQGEWLRILDQRQLPEKWVDIEARDVPTVGEAIRTLSVRGAPAIGIAAAYGVVIGAMYPDGAEITVAAQNAIDYLRTTRPTAVNLFYALDRMQKVLDASASDSDLVDQLLTEAHSILEEDLATGVAIGKAGLALFPTEGSAAVLTHCNAGGLATSGWGTALAPIYAAKVEGRDVQVFADETRPLLQGSRLTAWELAQANIPVTVLVDGASASLLRSGKVDLVIVGADRIAANGDAANKIGTYAVALAAKQAGVPFYVAAPSSTFDLTLPSGADIPIEERADQEVLHSPIEGVKAFNPAFDVTPAELIHGWITEKGVIRPPFAPNF
ncbi:MAG: S-methyl-5-thioribose-1-phosphate isomerase [Candidatus Eisenbacteria bacterium]|uniref:Methylthioribose-1-phosphate isomerase n=1 Tax=Eiseniibacteriota bacterium TaxID=2212470 RepID=A0A7Y2EAK9_UNCEI|nr:S-methyl-5-thioribose-1-phosphate isomerase [Candidatus Eisenbacteria bacterium]